VLFWKAVESQTGFKIAFEAFYRSGVNLLILGNESSSFLIGLFAVGLVENGLEFRFYQVLLFFWYLT